LRVMGWIYCCADETMSLPSWGAERRESRVHSSLSCDQQIAEFSLRNSVFFSEVKYYVSETIER
jgi:hypothetical protein